MQPTLIQPTKQIAATKRSSALYRERMISDCAAAVAAVNVAVCRDSAWLWLCADRGMDGQTAREIVDDVVALAIRIRRGEVTC